MNHLTPIQKVLLEECLALGSGGISLPMGEYGKTLLSLVVALEQRKTTSHKNPVLVVMSKTLLCSWITEIKKFFDDELKVLVYHQDFTKNLDSGLTETNIKNYDVVLTTVDVLAKAYRIGDLEQLFVKPTIINEGRFNQHIVNYYYSPTKPYLIATGGLLYLFSVEWGCVVVDEGHKYTNITSDKCQAICALCSGFRWLNSGTLFDEPKIPKILGYYTMINHPIFPRSIPDATAFVQDPNYKGYLNTTVSRGRNLECEMPHLKEITITHTTSKDEEILYHAFRQIISQFKKEFLKYKTEKNTVMMRKFGSYLLACLIYLRQMIVCPLLPVAKIIVDMMDLGNCKKNLSEILMAEIKKLPILDYLEDKESPYSSRIQEIIKTIKSHDELVIVFTSFRKVLDVISYYIVEKANRNVFIITSSMSTLSRNKIIQEFKESGNGVLCLTFEIGAVGLNLQFCNVVMIADLWWNDGMTRQALSRAYRFGQKNDVSVYYFLSNLGIEKAVFKKQAEKLSALGEMKEGAMKTKVNTMKIVDLIKIIELEDSKSHFDEIKQKRK